ERLTYDPTYCFQYTLNIVHGLGEHELFNLFFNSFTRSVISDLNRQTPENKVIMREYAYRFFRQLMRQYRLELPPLCYQWGLDYLKGQPLKKILFRLKNWYLRFRGRFLTQIVSCQIKEPFKVKFLGIPIGHLTEQRVGREKVKTFLMGRLPILTIREEV
ncbi:MAG: hypothetical protein SPL08_03170, partial [Pseudomonadota bacterium]|nr:hypothetical protein [Pseudomonadota bacterium]